MAGNPLVAGRSDSTSGYSGIGLVESATDYVNGIQSGSWVEIGIGVAGVGLETLSVAMDPAGALLSYGIAWLIEHVDALSEALDWLAGNPDAIAAHAETWGNVAMAVSGVAQDFTAAVADTTTWQGAAAEAYRVRADDIGNLLQAAATSAQGIGAAVEMAGLIVAAVREIVRDLIADLVSRLIVYAAELAATLGVAAPWVAAQATSLIARWAAKIADIVSKLVRTISNLVPLLRNLDEILSSVADAMGALRRGTRYTDTSPSTTVPARAAPPVTHTPESGHAPASTAPQSVGNAAPTTPPTPTAPSGAASSASATPEGPAPGTPDRSGQRSAIARALEGEPELTPGRHGGSSRPGDDGSLRSYERTLKWERDAYQAIRDSDDVDDVVRHLADVSRTDGSRGFSPEEIRQIKEHVFITEHPLEGVEGQTVMSRFDPSADIADAWLRLRSGRALDEDVILLEHELAESRYWQDNPGATYQEAHRAANEVARWETQVPTPTNEDYSAPWR